MTKMQIIAKAVLTALALSVISFILRPHKPLRVLGFPLWLGSLFSYALLLFFLYIIFELVARSDKWACKMMPPETIGNSDDLAHYAALVYRITTVLCGLIIFYYAIGRLESPLYTLMNPLERDKYQLYTFASIVEYIVSIHFKETLYLILALYLTCGAPHFVRWQVRRTIEYEEKRTGKTTWQRKSIISSEGNSK